VEEEKRRGREKRRWVGEEKERREEEKNEW
jgi:hypothetical protein